MTNEVDDTLNDRDTIKDSHGRTEYSSTGKIAALLVLFSVCGYLIYLMLSTADEKQSVELPKERVIKQTEFFQPTKPEPVPIELTEQGKTVLPKIELPTSKIVRPEFDTKLLDAAKRAPVLAYSGKQDTPKKADIKDRTSQNRIDTKPDEAAQHFHHLLNPTTLEGMRASTLGDRNYIIAMGTSIPCILETAINTDHQGFVSCIVSRDILSDNGRVVLLDKGTQIVGEYRAGLKKGQSRLFILWNRAKTPTGVLIALASPATDALGRSGIDGDIDNHWLERIGSALLVSIIKETTRYAHDRWFKDQSAKDSESIAKSLGQSAASIAAENYTKIPPTLTKNQGEMVSIFVARDLNFSNVYKLKVIDNTKQIVHRALSGNFYRNSMRGTK